MANNVPSITDPYDSKNIVANPDNIKTTVVFIDEGNEFFRPRVYDEPRMEKSYSMEWVQKAIELLEEMLRISRDRTLTVKLWAEANVQCGECYRGFHEWFEANPINDDWEAWLDKAEATIRENGWV